MIRSACSIILCLMSCFIVYSCFFHRKAIVKEEKQIKLLSSIPEEYIAMHIENDTTFICYFNYADWRSYIEAHNKDKEQIKRYFMYIDSNRKSKILNWGEIPDNFSKDILNSFFRNGQLYIKYNDGYTLGSMNYRKRISEKVEEEDFTDNSRSKILYHITLLLQGSRF